MPPGFLDYKGRDLRDKLDLCLEKNMWFFTLGGIFISVPICVKYKVGPARGGGGGAIRRLGGGGRCREAQRRRGRRRGRCRRTPLAGAAARL
jgi:hypothetical protein